MTKDALTVDVKATALVDRLLSELDNRAGFDNWWGGIDSETKREIRASLVDIVVVFGPSKCEK